MSPYERSTPGVCMSPFGGINSTQGEDKAKQIVRSADFSKILTKGTEVQAVYVQDAPSQKQYNIQCTPTWIRITNMNGFLPFVKPSCFAAFASRQGTVLINVAWIGFASYPPKDV